MAETNIDIEVRVEPGSDLAAALARAEQEHRRVVLVAGDRRLVVADVPAMLDHDFGDDPEAIWEGYDPERSYQALASLFGIWADRDTDAMIDEIYALRKVKGSRSEIEW